MIQSKGVTADGEIAYSQLPSLLDVTDSTIFSVVDSASNYKLNIGDLTKYFIQKSTTQKIWSAADGNMLVLTADDILKSTKIVINMQPDLSTLTGDFTLLIPATVGDDFAVKFEINYEGVDFSTARILTIEKDNGPIYYDSFVIISTGGSFAGLVAFFVQRFVFEIELGKLRRPYGLINLSSSILILGGKLPPFGGTGLVDNSNVKYLLKNVFYTAAGPNWDINTTGKITLGGLALFDYTSGEVANTESIYVPVKVISNGYHVSGLSLQGTDSLTQQRTTSVVYNIREIKADNGLPTLALYLAGESPI